MKDKRSLISDPFNRPKKSQVLRRTGVPPVRPTSKGLFAGPVLRQVTNLFVGVLPDLILFFATARLDWVIVISIKDETVTIALNVGAIPESPLQKCLIFI